METISASELTHQDNFRSGHGIIFDLDLGGDNGLLGRM